MIFFFDDALTKGVWLLEEKKKKKKVKEKKRGLNAKCVCTESALNEVNRIELSEVERQSKIHPSIFFCFKHMHIYAHTEVKRGKVEGG